MTFALPLLAALFAVGTYERATFGELVRVPALGFCIQKVPAWGTITDCRNEDGTWSRTTFVYDLPRLP